MKRISSVLLAVSVVASTIFGHSSGSTGKRNSLQNEFLELRLAEKSLAVNVAVDFWPDSSVTFMQYEAKADGGSNTNDATSGEAPKTELKLPPFKILKLQNGMTLLLMEQREVPLISFNFIIKTGSIADPVNKEGTAAATAGLLRKGTKSRAAEQLSAALDFIGGHLEAFASHDRTIGAAEFLKKDVVEGLELVADVILNPIFPEEEVSKLLKQRMDGIKAEKDEPAEIIKAYFDAYLYGSHPYGKPVKGHEKSRH